MSNQNNQTSPSPSPSLPHPRARPVDKTSPPPPTLKKVEKHSQQLTPPPSTKGLSGFGFEWAELNRATEILRFFAQGQQEV